MSEPQESNNAVRDAVHFMLECHKKNKRIAALEYELANAKADYSHMLRVSSDNINRLEGRNAKLISIAQELLASYSSEIMHTTGFPDDGLTIRARSLLEPTEEKGSK